jgi:hypothetical protein
LGAPMARVTVRKGIPLRNSPLRDPLARRPADHRWAISATTAVRSLSARESLMAVHTGP